MEIIINKDIRKVKTKDVWIFSWKQALSVAVATAIGGGILFLELKVFHFESINYYLMLIPMTIPLIFGFVKPFGMTFTQFLKTYVKENFTSPQTYTCTYKSVEEIESEFDWNELLDTYGEEIAYGDDLLSDFKLDRTSPEFKNELKKAQTLGF